MVSVVHCCARTTSRVRTRFREALAPSCALAFFASHNLAMYSIAPKWKPLFVTVCSSPSAVLAVLKTDQHTLISAPNAMFEPESGWPAVTDGTPARDEADFAGRHIGSLLSQDNPTVALVDDGSTDDDARAAARGAQRLVILSAGALPRGRTGKRLCRGCRRSRVVEPAEESTS